MSITHMFWRYVIQASILTEFKRLYNIINILNTNKPCMKMLSVCYATGLALSLNCNNKSHCLSIGGFCNIRFAPMIFGPKEIERIHN
jgi:hypothetical protein